jgi:hypothetical protein
MKLVTAAALGIAALSASPAYAGCASWDISGDALSVDQSNGHFAYFRNARLVGNELSGSAYYMYVKPSDDVLGDLGLKLEDAAFVGDVEGSMTGSHAEFRVRWRQTNGASGPIGVYSLDIDDTGRISGETYDFEHPNSRAQLLGVRKVACLASNDPPPPVHYNRLGKRKPQPAPVNPQSSMAVIGSASTMALPNRCAQGFVWREAREGDLVCVPPESRSRAAAENSRSASLWVSGAYGPHTCASGFVWREAFSGDTVCVTPEVRDLVRSENSLADSRKAQ